MSDVRTWLAGIGLGQYADAFEATMSRWTLLHGVDDQVAGDIGVTSAHRPPRLRLRAPIASWRPHRSKRYEQRRRCTRGRRRFRRTPPAQRDVLRSRRLHRPLVAPRSRGSAGGHPHLPGVRRHHHPAVRRLHRSLCWRRSADLFRLAGSSARPTLNAPFVPASPLPRRSARP